MSSSVAMGCNPSLSERLNRNRGFQEADGDRAAKLHATSSWTFPVYPPSPCATLTGSAGGRRSSPAPPRLRLRLPGSPNGEERSIVPPGAEGACQVFSVGIYQGFSPPDFGIYLMVDSPSARVSPKAKAGGGLGKTPGGIRCTPTVRQCHSRDA